MSKFINFISSIPPLIKNKFLKPATFTNSEEYWINRYKQGGNSGAGSYYNLAEFKADVINDFVAKNEIKSVIELGCGDGNQLKYFNIPSYIGFDISPLIIQKCKTKFNKDKSKQFLLMNEAPNHRADLVLSLDVLFHLVEEETFNNYLNLLFDIAEKSVIIYAYDNDDPKVFSQHVKPRNFTNWIKENKNEFELIEHIPNKFPFIESKASTTSVCDFYIFKRRK